MGYSPEGDIPFRDIGEHLKDSQDIARRGYPF